MYTPSYFLVEDPQMIRDFIARHGFGILISLSNTELETTHIPMYLSEDGKFIFGHLAKANEQWKGWAAEPKVKAIFSGPHSYISPSFYTSSSNVPTWNYTAVAVDGTIEIIDDLEEQKSIINHLTHQYESSLPNPWKLDASNDKLMNMFKAIVCFKICILNTNAKFKLNQNKTAEDQRSVIQHLKNSGSSMDLEVAKLMESKL
jgi:transcriptional regulator